MGLGSQRSRNDPAAGDSTTRGLWPTGGGAIGALIRSFDWADTPLGPVQGWPPGLRTIVDTVVHSPLPMVILWGRDLIQIYNDAFARIAGAKHPAAFGRPAVACWPEVQDFTAPVHAAVLRGESLSFQAQKLTFQRNGRAEEVWLDLTYSPLRDPAQTVVGILATAVDVTNRVLAESALRLSEQRLQVALQAADLGTWDLDLTTGTASVRDLRHDQMFGYAELQPRWGEAIAERHVLPEDRPIFRAAFAQARRTGILSFEARVRWPDGSVHWIAPRGRTHVDADGRPVRMSGVVADITGPRMAEQRLRESEAKYRTLFDSMDQGYCILEVLFDGAGAAVDYRFVQVNPAFGKQSGMHDAVGCTMRELVPDIEPFWAEVYGDVARTGIPTRFVEHARSMGRWFDVYAFRLGDSGANRVAVLFTDITVRKRAEENAVFLADISECISRLSTATDIVREVGARIGRHLDVSRCVFCDVDDQNGTSIISQEWHRPDLPGIVDGRLRRIDEFIHGELRLALRRGQAIVVDNVGSADGVDASNTAALGIGAYITAPFVKDGWCRFLVNCSTSEPRAWRDDEVALVRELAARIWFRLERVRAEADLLARSVDAEQARAEAEQANRAKSRFLAAASHDLRQPVTAAVLYLDLLRRRLVDPEQLRLADLLRLTLNAQLGLLNGLLENARLEAGVVTPELRPLLLDHLLQRLAGEFQVQAEAAGLTLRVEPTAIVVNTDPLLLELILRNLIDNALKYTRAGSVAVSAIRIGDRVRLDVRDTGPGIPADRIDRIFGDFYQDAETPGAARGFGIGLATVRRMSDLLGYRVEVRSEPGRGSVFTLSLDAGTAEDGRRTGPEPAERTARPAAVPVHREILVAEDDPLIGTALEMMLRDRGYGVTLVHSAGAACRAARDRAVPFDACLCDYQLGDGTGLDVAAAARARGPVPILLLTGDTAPPVLKAAEQADVHLLHKPIQPKALFAALDGLFAAGGA